MTEAERLRMRAVRCLRLARLVHSTVLSAGLTARAAEYMERATALEGGFGQQEQQGTRPRPTPAHGQQPALQQQQVQPKGGDGDEDP